MGSLRKYVLIKFSQGLSVGTAGCFPAPRGPFSGSPGRPGRPGARFPAPRNPFAGSPGAPAHSYAISPACPLELWTPSEHGACHARATLTPSALLVPWRSGPPPHAAHATQQPTLTPSAQPVLWNSGLTPNTADATQSPLSRHQPSLSSVALHCSAQPILWTSAKAVLCHSRAVSPACPLELWTPSLSSAALDCLRAHRLPPQAHSHTISPAYSSGTLDCSGPKDRTLGSTMLLGSPPLGWAGAESGGGGILGSAHVHQQANIDCTTQIAPHRLHSITCTT
jgi:hypothetical protein